MKNLFLLVALVFSLTFISSAQADEKPDCSKLVASAELLGGAAVITFATPPAVALGSLLVVSGVIEVDECTINIFEESGIWWGEAIYDTEQRVREYIRSKTAESQSEETSSSTGSI